jgi:protein tyrosine phosphatase (PTP) superfamily phosphohydrolase (DUF442 family)
MNNIPLDQIVNYYQVTENIATSGQPTESQLANIAAAGYQVVINLALPSSNNALANEGAIVTNLKMTYIHIPVNWETPQLDDLRLFFQVMDALGDRQIWIHCAKNMRVSCFIYLWQKYILKLSEEVASYPMKQIWQPTGVWQQFIKEAQITFG